MGLAKPPRNEESNSEVHRDVTSAGVRLRATEWVSPHGSNDAPAIVALPGALSPRTSFAALARALQPSFRLIAVDFPGFGESEKPSPNRFPYSVEAFSEAIADLFAGLQLPGAHLLGHGLGGAVALHLAVQHPELVKRLALIAPLIRPPLQYKALLAPVVGGLLLRQLLGRTWFGNIYRERINPEIATAQLDEYYESLSMPASRAALLATLRSCQDPRSIIATSRRVRPPTLIVWGRNDRLFPVEGGRFLSREMPQAGLEILESGHAPHEEVPTETASTLIRFFAGQRAGLS